MEPPTLNPQNDPSAVKTLRRAPPSSNKRPLRTYSKRASTDAGEPVSKKRRIGDANLVPTSEVITAESTRDSRIRQASPTLPPPPPVKKGTIMSYFKIVPSVSSSTLQSSEPPSEPPGPTSTPPSSPPLPDTKRRKRRRLTTRITPQSTSEDRKTEELAKTDGDCEGQDVVGDGTRPAEGDSGILSESSLSALNRKASSQRERSEAGKRGRSSKATTVQTTLSLTMEDKGFTECKECNMLYNPVHKDDAKCHAKRHAAMLKAKSKASRHNNEISD
ncbi:hypothetical protein F4677DRAFT_274686 [Hypoxylon crocopeplum]|nr:hypothetical protein F4677DRAFT_274686 [Hypoxylon crocopeplum]